MLDDFFVRALLAGTGTALIAGPIGCVIIWRRMAYFGDTVAHSALLGVGLGVLLDVNLTIAVFTIAAFVALALHLLQGRAHLASDALLGLLAHGSLAIGLVVLSLITWRRIDLNALLFGDVLAVSRIDLFWIFGGGIAVLVVLAFVWRPLFAMTVNRDLAAAEGVNAGLIDLVFTLLVAAVIAISIKIAGVLLITALLIIPAASARQIVGGPETMAVTSAILGVVCVWLGLFGSLYIDTPSGPSVVVAALMVFLVCITFGHWIIRLPNGWWRVKLRGDHE